MTIEEFDQTAFKSGMKAIYKAETYDVVSVDFIEKLLELNIDIAKDQTSIVVRCENVELIN